MTKQEQFLWIVQTTVLANGSNLSSQPKLAAKYRHVYSASGVLGLAGDAIDASERIPDEMTAFEAANEFCSYMLQNLREAEAKAENVLQVPYWFARS